MTEQSADPLVQAIYDDLIDERDRRVRECGLDPLSAAVTIRRDVEVFFAGVEAGRRAVTGDTR